MIPSNWFEKITTKIQDAHEDILQKIEEKEKPVLRVLQVLVYIFEQRGESIYCGSQIDRPVGYWTHNVPVFHYHMKKNDERKMFSKILKETRLQFKRAELHFQVKKVNRPSEHQMRFEYICVSGDISFKIIIWFHSGGICRTVEDGYETAKPKYKVVCGDKEAA